MIKIDFEIQGHKVNSSDFADSIEAAVLEGVRTDLQAKLMAVRDPETGESPTVVVRGRDWDNLAIELSGSEKVLALAREALGIGDDQTAAGNGVSPTNTKDVITPCVFLCHASEDKPLAQKIAEEFMRQGVDTFFDQWEIAPGDSIVQKIDAGLAGCTHFFALLTPKSISKPWVKAEIDAGFLRKIEGRCKFVPLRVGLTVDALPPLMKPLYSPEISDYDNDLKTLISFLHGVSQKPSLGTPPAILQKSSRGRLGVSVAAEAIVRYMVENSVNGVYGDPGLSPQEIREITGLCDDDIVDAVEELEARDFVQALRTLDSGQLGFATLTAKPCLFANFDKYFKEWDSEADALQVASSLINGVGQGLVSELAAQHQWEPRRMNPAIMFLEEHKLVQTSATLGAHPWVRYWIGKTSATRRFVRDRT